MVERNPSPPREFDDEAELFRQDMIGNTTISKKWVYTTLLDLCKEVERHSDEKDSDDVDISEELQDEACRLWDLCIEEDLAKFLIDIKSTKFFCRILSGSRSSRLTEIVVGILGNLACLSEACQSITSNTDLLASVVSLLSCRDSPTLVEVGRFLNTCLSDEKSKDLWLDFLGLVLPEYIEDLIFIFGSSANSLVLKNLLEVIDICLDARPGLLPVFVSIEFTDALIEAGLQLISDDESSPGIDYCLHSLYTLTAEDKTAADTYKDNSKIFNFILKCFDRWRTMEEIIIKKDPSAVLVASSLAVLDFILNSSFSKDKSTFLENISLNERSCIHDIAQVVEKFCKDELQKSSYSSDKTPAENSADNQSNSPKQTPQSDDVNGEFKNSVCDVKKDLSFDTLFDGVPLYGIVNDLKETLKRLHWEELN